MPQGSWLGPLSFLVLVDDLTGCLTHKYVDDSTLSELLQSNSSHSSMTNYLQNLIDWTAVNDMQLNTSKTKEMVFGRLAQTDLPLLTTTTGTIERVTSF